MRFTPSSARSLFFAAAMSAPLLISSTVRADDEPAKPRKGLVVTVEDNDVVAAEEAASAQAEVEEAPAPKKKSKRKQRREELEDAPGSDASEAEIDAYLRELSRDVRDTQADLRAAKRGDDPEEIMELENDLREKKELLRDERDRLTTTEPGLVAGGAVLTGLGGVSLVTSIVLLIGWPLSGVDGHFDDEYGWGSLGCLLGGAAGLGVGIPMIAAGARRTVRGSDDGVAYEEARVPTLPLGPRAGLTFTVPF